jgi:hypothetical protein
MTRPSQAYNFNIVKDTQLGIRDSIPVKGRELFLLHYNIQSDP